MSDEIIELEEKREKITKEFIEVREKKHIITSFILIILFFISITSFVITLISKDTSIISLISSLILTLFTILFVVVSITYKRRKKYGVFFSSLLLISYFVIGINNSIGFIKTPFEEMPNFQNKSLVSVMKWAKNNKINVEQIYEYSDMIDEYKIISQNIEPLTDMNKVKNVIVAVSEGANPSKEIILPSMISWDSERVIKYVIDNHLSNVSVEFVESDMEANTVIEQNTSGNFKRNDELKLTFSYGEELGYDEVKLIDFTNKSKFEVEFYMKEHQLKYEFSDDFSNKVKKGYAITQDKKPGDTIKVNDEVIKVTISKGRKVKVPNISKMSITDITEWAIKNKIKLNFSDKYDDKVKENNIVEANYKEGDVIEEGEVVKVVISRGGLKMPKFKSIDDFYRWANKYDIKYEEIHEFNSSVAAGEVISYSYKTGEVIKSDDIIKVTISDGEASTVPNLKGLSKNEAKKKLDKLGIKYSFTYKNSNEDKDTVLSQSISSGSEITQGTTISITLSNGKKDNTTTQKKVSTKEKNNDNNVNKDSNNTNSNASNQNNNSNNNNQSNNTQKEENNTPAPTPTVEKITVYIYDELIKSSPSGTCSAIKGAYPKLNFTCSYACGQYNGALINSSSIDENTFSTNETINLRISDNDKC